MISARELLSTELSRAYDAGQCAVVVCQLASMKEIGNQYGPQGVDEALKALSMLLLRAVPPGAKVAKLKLTIFGIVLRGDGQTALALARDIVQQADREPVIVAKNRAVHLKVAVGVAASNEGSGLAPTQLVFEASWRALDVAPYQKGSIASG